MRNFLLFCIWVALAWLGYMASVAVDILEKVVK